MTEASRPNPLLAGLSTVAAPASAIVAQSVADMPGGVGSVVAAVVAPKTGFIEHPAGTPVVLVVKGFWESPTMKWLRRTIYAAFALAFVVAFGPAVTAGNLEGVNWADVKGTFLKAFLYALVAAFFGVLKKIDNDPVK